MNTTALSENVQKTMSSIDLLGVINQSREENGEPSLRRNRFHEKVADELEGEHYTKSVVTNSNGTKSEVLMLTHDQCMLVSMRESKAVRRSVLEKLNAAEKGDLPDAKPDQSRLNGELALLECFCSLNNPAPSSRILLLEKIGNAHGLNTGWLPGHAEDGPSDAADGSMDTASATALLDEHDIRITARDFNQRLSSLGIIERRTRKARNGTKPYWCVTQKGSPYGKNITAPQSPRETQPHYYRERFINLLALVGTEGAPA